MRDYLVTGITDSELEVSHFDDQRNEHRDRYPLSEARPEYFAVRHHYAVWRLDYASLNRAFFAVLFHLNLLLLISQRPYDRGLQQYRTRMEILRTLVSLWKPELNTQIQIREVLEHLYGPRIATSKKGYAYHRRLVFVLQSLAKSGDLDLNHPDVPSEVRLQPQALQTLADYELESERHERAIRLTRYQLLVAVAMLFVALATLMTRCNRIGSSDRNAAADVTHVKRAQAIGAYQPQV